MILIKRIILCSLSVFAALLIGVAIGRNDFTKQASLKSVADSASGGIGQNTANQTVQNGQNDVAVVSNIPNTSSAMLNNSSASQPNNSGYLIKVMDGILMVYADGNTDNAPYMSVEIDFDSLPQEDRTLLQNGIYANNDAQLQQILEDYAG